MGISITLVFIVDFADADAASRGGCSSDFPFMLGKSVEDSVHWKCNKGFPIRFTPSSVRYPRNERVQSVPIVRGRLRCTIASV